MTIRDEKLDLASFLPSTQRFGVVAIALSLLGPQPHAQAAVGALAWAGGEKAGGARGGE